MGSRFSRFTTRWLSHRRWLFLAGALAVAVTLPALGTGLGADDYIHRAMLLRVPGFATEPLGLFSFVSAGDDGAAISRSSLPWWFPPDLRIAFWRPVTALTHWLDHALWSESPWLMHLQSLLWYAAAVVLVGLLFQRILGGGWVAGLATLVYAVDPTHALSVQFLAGRNALLGVAFGAATLLLHDRWRRSGHRDGACIAPVLLALGLLSSEGAIATVAYVLAHAVFLDRGTVRSRAISIVPYLLVVMIWRFAYQRLGYGVTASPGYIDPLESPSRFVRAVGERAPPYVLGEWLAPPTELAFLGDLGTVTVCGVVFLVLLLALLSPLLARDRVARFWCAGMLLSLVPACAGPSGDRMLFYVGIGGAALLARLVEHRGGTRPSPLAFSARGLRIVTRAVAVVLIVLHVVLAPPWLAMRILASAKSLQELTAGDQVLARRPDISHKMVVLLDDYRFTGVHLPAVRAFSGLDPVEQVLVLAPVSRYGDSIVLTRPAENTLVMDIESDQIGVVPGDDEHPFVPGDVVRRPHVTIEAQSVRHGRPTRVAFHFDRSLDDPFIVWLGKLENVSRCASPHELNYPTWTPPPVGTAVSLR